MSDHSNTATRRAASTPAERNFPQHLAAKHQISLQQARDLMAEVGPDRERLDVVARAVRMASEG